MFYEVVIYEEYIDGLINLLSTVNNKNNVYIDLCFNVSEKIEKIDTTKVSKDALITLFYVGVDRLYEIGMTNIVARVIDDVDDFYFHADYRRDLNYNYCNKVDYVMHGETDSFFPKEAFRALEGIYDYATSAGIHRHVVCFADRKMWDSSWDATVHEKFINHVYDDGPDGHLNPNQAKSRMSIDEMNAINSEIEQLEIINIQYPKIDGSCLVLSSDLIKFGVNVPSCLIYNDDHGVSIMIDKLCKDTYVQFICKNLLKVHARRHPKKRLFVMNEDNPYSFANKIDVFEEFKNMSNKNIQILLNQSNDKFYTVADYLTLIKNKNL
jgi:hypothetical protein